MSQHYKSWIFYLRVVIKDVLEIGTEKIYLLRNTWKISIKLFENVIFFYMVRCHIIYKKVL